jgi:histone H3/H4
MGNPFRKDEVTMPQDAEKAGGVPAAADATGGDPPPPVASTPTEAEDAGARAVPAAPKPAARAAAKPRRPRASPSAIRSAEERYRRQAEAAQAEIARIAALLADLAAGKSVSHRDIGAAMKRASGAALAAADNKATADTGRALRLRGEMHGVADYLVARAMDDGVPPDALEARIGALLDRVQRREPVADLAEALRTFGQA